MNPLRKKKRHAHSRLGGLVGARTNTPPSHTPPTPSHPPPILSLSPLPRHHQGIRPGSLLGAKLCGDAVQSMGSRSSQCMTPQMYSGSVTR